MSNQAIDTDIRIKVSPEAISTSSVNLGELPLLLGDDFSRQFQNTKPGGFGLSFSSGEYSSSVSTRSRFDKLFSLTQQIQLKSVDGPRAFTYLTKEGEIRRVMVLSHEIKKDELSEAEPNTRVIYLIDPIWNAGRGKFQYRVYDVFFINPVGKVDLLRNDVGKREIILDFGDRGPRSSMMTEDTLTMRVLETERDAARLDHELGHGEQNISQEEIDSYEYSLKKAKLKSGNHESSTELIETDRSNIKKLISLEEDAWEKAERRRDKRERDDFVLCSLQVMQEETQKQLVDYRFYLNI